MLHPNEFGVNEAWIAFQLNEAPISTQADGPFNCVALMDAASCFLLAMAPVSASRAEPTEAEARQLLKGALAHKKEWPKTLFVPTGYRVDTLVQEVERRGVAVVRVAEEQLALILGGARESFREHFGGGVVH
ncbi:MAG TPA: hypothetical protein PK413_16975 [Thermoanaerobaculia bacterium]|nr:hypothetical protein [Thermoanaerobaculia bacterium]